MDHRPSRKMNSAIFGLFLWPLIFHVNCDLIELKSGVINGTVAKSIKGRLFHQFYSIPYAEPPVGKLRLKNPVPVEPWSDVKDASKPPPKCTQPTRMFGHNNPVTGQEDCLYLNVFVPDDLFTPSRKAPVMVGIHGGAFKTGAGTKYRPDYFMDQDVIFVTLNYRLGVFGFFGLNNDQISGNFGLKDQALALRWVHENIARFGGDPGNVTLIGESAGAASVHLQMFSPLSGGLFGKAIMQSGSGFGEWAYYDDGFGESVATAFLVVSGCVRKDPAVVLKCLQRISTEDFYALESYLMDSYAAPNILFKPMVESKVKNQPFLTHKPSSGTYQTYVPWITGINSGEGAILVFSKKMDKADRKTILSSIDHHLFTSEPENIDNLVQEIIDYYFSDEEMGDENLRIKFSDLSTDAEFLYPFVKTVKSNRRQQYVYLYDHRGSFSALNFVNFSTDLGVCHADELPLLFRDEKLEVKWTPQDKIISETLVKFWTNFAISGDPNGQSEEKIWKPVETDDIEYLHIKSDSLVMKKKFSKRGPIFGNLYRFISKIPKI